MAIRFACPSCRQPIEIDDQWAGQSVACPYCKRVVTAPPQSTWPAGEVPMASPAGGPLPPPPPAAIGEPGVYPPGQRLPLQTRGNSAGTALALAILSIVLCIVGVVSFVRPLEDIVVAKTGPNPTPEQAAEIVQQALQTGGIPVSSFAVAAALIGLMCAIGSLVLGLRALIRQEPRKVTATVACITGALFIFCQGLFTLVLLAASVRHPIPTGG